MNWQRGMIRVWLCGSICWVLGVAWFGYMDLWVHRQGAIKQQAEQKVCADERTKNPSLGNPFECFTEVRFDDLVPLTPSLLRYIALAGGPVIAILIFGGAVFWVVSGFKRGPPRSENQGDVTNDF